MSEEAYAGKRLCRNGGCLVWMVDDARPHCEVCKLATESHLAVAPDGQRWVVVPGIAQGPTP